MDMASVFETETMQVQVLPGRLKYCPGADHDVSIDRFRKRANGKDQSWCIDCTKRRSDQHYQENKDRVIQRSKLRNTKIRNDIRKWIWTYLSTSVCIECGESDPVLLDFHHRDRTTKEFNIGSTQNRRTLGQIQAEVAKCDVLCVVCHRRQTALEGNWWKLTFQL